MSDESPLPTAADSAVKWDIGHAWVRPSVPLMTGNGYCAADPALTAQLTRIEEKLDRLAAMAVGSLILALFFGLVFNAPLPDDRRKDKTP